MATINDARYDSDSDDGEDFNPEPAVGSDDGADSEEEVAVKPKSKSTSRKATPPSPDEANGRLNGDRAGAGGDDDEDLDDDDNLANGKEEEDDDDNDDGEDGADDDEDEDNVTGRPRKRARRDPRNQFIDIEAEVDDEDEGDEDDEEDGAADFIAKDHPDDLEDLQPGTEHDDRRHRELDRKRELAQQMDAEKQAALLKERYGRRQVATQQVSQVPRRLLLPSVDDPSIWGVRCKPGKEREVVFSILKRWEERLGSKDALPIFSAFERGSTSMTGYVYVEARKQSDVMSALDGILFCYPRTNMVLVAIKEMPDLLRVQKSEQLQPGGYVRIRTGKYKGDLAQVDDVETNGLEVSLRIVPRLDYGLNDDAAGAETGADGKRKRGFAKSGPIPPQRLFSEAEARKRHSRFLQAVTTFDKKQWNYHGDTYVNGYLIKDFRIQQLQTKDVNPTLEEVSKFAAGAEDGTENLDLTALASSLKNNTTSDSYLPGDTVEIYEGEQSGITGKATAVRGDIVTINVTEGDIKGQTIDVPMKGLRKRFRPGDHVKIIGGSRFRDEVGMVVTLKGDQVTMVSDLTMQEITVFSKDLREATDTGAAGGLGSYDIHDLVQLDPATVGCVTKVDRESMRVLDQNGRVRTVMPSQISNKIDRRRNAVATDRNGAEIRQDDTVKEIGGESKTGVIVHIHRAYLFCHNREQTENSGVFVVRATNVATVAAKGGRIAAQKQSGPDLDRMNPAMQRGGANGAGAMPPPMNKGGGRDRSLGQTVTVRKGPYKGLLGIVKDATDTEARVELHTKGKTIQIKKDCLGFKDSSSGNTVSYNDFVSRGRRPGASVSSSPFSGGGGGGGWGGATPRAGGGGGGGSEWGGSRTPMAAGNGGRTPAWGGMSSRTPAWSGAGGSSGGGSGGGGLPARTPAWAGASSGGGGGGNWGGGGAGAGGGRTPAWSGGGDRTAYGGGSFGGGGGRTPAWGDGGRTPAYSGFGSGRDGGARDAPTPAASAPTPGSSYRDAPTPGRDGWGRESVKDAPTPWKDAPTPAAGAPTPFAGGPETPAAWGADDDDGPRYVDDDE